jgi:hypothetical protein
MKVLLLFCSEMNEQIRGTEAYFIQTATGNGRELRHDLCPGKQMGDFFPGDGIRLW